MVKAHIKPFLKYDIKKVYRTIEVKINKITTHLYFNETKIHRASVLY